MNCPRYGETEIVKNSSLTNGKPKYKCKVCGRQLVENPKKGRISEETQELIDKLFIIREIIASGDSASDRGIRTRVAKRC